MENIKVLNGRSVTNSVQVSTLKNIPAGNFEPGVIFLVKNITDANISIRGILPNNKGEAGNYEEIETVLYPGWNVEVFIKLFNVPESSLQYGF